MPKYTYKCNLCNETFEVYHSITEKLTECECGGMKSLRRIPSVINSTTKKPTTSNPGQIVKEFIEDAKKEVSDFKKETREGLEDA